MYSNYLILFVTLYWLWTVASAVLLQRSDFETFIRRSWIYSRSKPQFSIPHLLHIWNDSFPFLIRHRLPLIVSNSRTINVSKIYQRYEEKEEKEEWKKGGKKSSRFIPLTNQSDVKKRRRKIVVEEYTRFRVLEIQGRGANNACKHAQTGEESRMHRGCIESAPFGEHFVSLEDPTLVPKGSETDNSWRVVRGRSEGGWEVADKFLERFRQLEEALDVRKAASKDRWACLPVRSCLNFKVRRWGRP